MTQKADRFLGPFVILQGMEDYTYERNQMALIDYKKADGTKQKHVFFKCPCGCGNHTCLPVEGQKKWHLTIDQKNRPTLSPSLQQIGGCDAHFFIVNGNVDFC